MREEDLIAGTKYRTKSGNTFLLFREYDPNVECFQRQDGQLHFGREFIEFKEGRRDIDLQVANSPHEGKNCLGPGCIYCDEEDA